jgi:hypothetical protein
VKAMAAKMRMHVCLNICEVSWVRIQNFAKSSLEFEKVCSFVTGQK